MKIKRLLLVEDCDEDLKLLMHSLEKGQQSDAGSQPGVVYDTASSLSEAIAYLSEGKPDVIISDLNLPDSQGLATISSLLDATGAPIIAVTSISERHVAEEAVRSGAQEYIEKDSLNPARVWRCIRHAIDRKDIQNERDEMRAVLEEKRRFETLGRFAGGIAHDINNRLGIIRGTTQMLTAEDCSPQMTEDLSLIMAETDRVANLIQQLVQAGGEDDRVSCAGP